MCPRKRRNRCKNKKEFLNKSFKLLYYILYKYFYTLSIKYLLISSTKIEASRMRNTLELLEILQIQIDKNIIVIYLTQGLK